MLIAISHYTKPVAEVDLHQAVHVEYLKNLIAANKLLLAGRQTPPVGAVIIANNISRDEFKTILDNDPYCKVGVAEYKIIEFKSALCDEAFRAFAY